MNIRIVAVGVLFVSSFVFAQPRDVFFAGGQSNARPEWASAIQATLSASGKYNNPLVVHAYHPGASLGSWWENDTAQANYEADFFKASSTGVLQTALQDIVAGGGEYNFRGFFWFQGESDCVPASTAVYQEKFTAMLDNLKADLGVDEPIKFCLAVVDLNPDPIYDNPGYGITREYVEGLRNVQFDLGSLQNGSCVDTRGFYRTDAWHLNVDGLTSVGELMGQEIVPEPASIFMLFGGLIALVSKFKKK